MLMKIRVFQIDHEKDEKNLAFRDYQTALAKNGRIDESIYKQVYGGEVPCRTLEEVYALCNGEHKPLGYIAESMSVSNVVEVTQSNNQLWRSNIQNRRGKEENQHRRTSLLGVC